MGAPARRSRPVADLADAAGVRRSGAARISHRATKTNAPPSGEVRGGAVVDPPGIEPGRIAACTYPALAFLRGDYAAGDGPIERSGYPPADILSTRSGYRAVTAPSPRTSRRRERHAHRRAQHTDAPALRRSTSQRDAEVRARGAEGRAAGVEHVDHAVITDGPAPHPIAPQVDARVDGAARRGPAHVIAPRHVADVLPAAPLSSPVEPERGGHRRRPASHARIAGCTRTTAPGTSGAASSQARPRTAATTSPRSTPAQARAARLTRSPARAGWPVRRCRPRRARARPASARSRRGRDRPPRGSAAPP